MEEMPILQSVNNPNAMITLEEAEQKLRMLLAQGEDTAWETGDLLNWIEKRGLVRSEGFGKTRSWLEAKVPAAQGKITTLYRHAKLAANYSKEHVAKWGLARLEYLMVHDQETLGNLVPGDPGPRELQLHQKDGAIAVKRFCDCSANELRQSNQVRKRGQKPARPAAGPAPETPSPLATKPTQLESLRGAMALVASGVVVTIGASFLPASLLTTAIFLIGFSLLLHGSTILIRRWQILRERVLHALGQGKATDILKGELAKVRGGAQKLLVAIRSGIKTLEPKGSEGTNPAKDSQGSPPPEQKKAA